MPVTTTPAITSKQELIDLINKDNRTSLSVDDVTLSAPVVVSLAGRNTKVTITAVDDSKYSGGMDVYYNRLALSDLGFIGIVSGEPLSTDELLQAISTKKGINLLAEEFETFSIPVLETGQQANITLVAKETAIKWYGQVKVEYAFSLPPGLDELDKLIHTLSMPSYLT